jgi:hypothetical protein
MREDALEHVKFCMFYSEDSAERYKIYVKDVKYTPRRAQKSPEEPRRVLR